MDHEEPDASIQNVLVDHPSVRLKTSGLSGGRQVGAVQAVDASAIAIQQFTHGRLCRDSLVLGQQRPPATQTVLRPDVISHVLCVVGEVVSNDVDEPSPLSQKLRRTPT